VLESQRTFQMPQMYAAVVALGMIGYVLNRLFLALDTWAMAWHKGLTRREDL
jgi:ABC-type nitrate/sulfonate/bicarbonate transport system permease component